MKTFIDVLVRLPGLRTLELLGVDKRGPVSRGLKRKCAIFPSIREMTVCSVYPDFIKSCPNLEGLTFRYDHGEGYSEALQLYGAKLKRIRGVKVGVFVSLNTECEFRKVPSDLGQSLNRPGL